MTRVREQRARRIRAYVQEHDPIVRTEMEYAGLKPGYIKRAPVAWFASHHHTPDGANEPYSYSCIFAYTLDLPAGATSLTLPDNRRIRLLAATVAKEFPQVTPAHPLYDTLERANVDFARWNASVNPVNPASLAFGAVRLGGTSPTLPDVDLSEKRIDLHDGDIFYVHMTYDGAALAWTIADSATGKSFSTSAPLNISQALGASAGYVGFTAATGGLTSTQEILTWTFQ